MSIIAVSGKIGSGKDTVGKIIQYLIWSNSNSNPVDSYNFKHWLKNDKHPVLHKHHMNGNYQIVKFADGVKDIVCLLTGCTREQLEDQDFKNSVISEDWDCFFIVGPYGDVISKPFATREEAELNLNEAIGDIGLSEKCFILKKSMTYRIMMLLVGTEAGRNIIHPNIWINSLFSKYKHYAVAHSNTLHNVYPNWIITDLRFKNEAFHVKKRDGLTIRVNRNQECSSCSPLKHQSEVDLDDYSFDYVIDNNDSIGNLIQEVEIILNRERILI